MESTLNVLIDKSLWNSSNSFEITEQDTEECLKQTMYKYFPGGDYSFLQQKTDILIYFYNNEEDCLKYIETIKPNIKKKVLKQTFLENLYNFFIYQPDIQSQTSEIIQTINSIKLEKCQSKEDLYEQLNKELQTKNIPMFLIKEKLKILSIYLFMNNYVLNFFDLINKNIDVKELIFFYNEIEENKRHIFEFQIPFPDKFYQDLFDLFIMSNYLNYHRSKGIKNVFNNYYIIIRDLFCKNQQDNNTTKIEYLNALINLSINEINQKLETTITNIKNALNQTHKVAFQQLLIIIASYFHLVKNTLIPLFDIDNVEKESINTPIFMNLFYSVMRVIISHFQYMKLDLPALIGYLDCYTVLNHNLSKKQSIIDTRLFTFNDLEILFSNTHKNIFNRFDSIRKKLLNKTAASPKLEGKNIENAVLHLLNEPPRSINCLNTFELFPFATQHYSNTITILISGFLSESSNYLKDWKHIIHNGSKYSMYYGYRWPSGSELKLVYNLLSLNKMGLIKRGKQYFIKNKYKAKYAGKLLGIIIQSRQIFKNCKINLIGFSLGCHVIKYCLKEMENNKSDCLINNVYLFGGATYFGNSFLWENIFANQISGRIVNCYSQVDEILKRLYSLSTGQNAIGNDPIEIESEKFKIENYDLTDLNIGHLSYRDNLDMILKFINYSASI